MDKRLMNRAVIGDDDAAHVLRMAGVSGLKKQAGFVPPLSNKPLPAKADSFAWLNDGQPIDLEKVKTDEVLKVLKWLEAGTELIFTFGRHDYRCFKREVLQIGIYGINKVYRTSWRSLPASEMNIQCLAVYCAMHNARPYGDVWFRTSFGFNHGTSHGGWIYGTTS